MVVLDLKCREIVPLAGGRRRAPGALIYMVCMCGAAGCGGSRLLNPLFTVRLTGVEVRALDVPDEAGRG